MTITRREAMTQGHRCQWGFGEVRPKSFDICGELVCGRHTELDDCYCAEHRAGMFSKRRAGGHFSMPHSAVPHLR
jgi:hypothetical protein